MKHCAPLLLLLACAAPPPADPAAAAILERHDGDGDGRVTAAEYDRGAQAFAHLDRDADGAVTSEDFARPFVMPADLTTPMLLVRWFGGAGVMTADLATAEAGFAQADADHDGRVTRTEFEPLLLAGNASPGPDRFGTLLAGADGDGDGALSLDEVRAQWKERDLDGDGQLGMVEGLLTEHPPGRVNLPVGWVAPDARQPAPEIELPRLDGSDRASLSSLRGGPVAVVFGSFTCPPFRAGTVEVKDLVARYGDRVRFVFVYLREAHAIDGGWPMTVPDQPVVEDPRVLDERVAVAKDCVSTLALDDMLALVDEMDDRANRAYEAWPDRLVLVDAQGRLAFRSDLGPYGFEPAELEDAIRKELGPPDE